MDVYFDRIFHTKEIKELSFASSDSQFEMLKCTGLYPVLKVHHITYVEQLSVLTLNFYILVQDVIAKGPFVFEYFPDICHKPLSSYLTKKFKYPKKIT